MGLRGSCLGGVHDSNTAQHIRKGGQKMGCLSKLREHTGGGLKEAH